MPANFATPQDVKAWAVATIKELLAHGKDEEGRRWTMASLGERLGVSHGQIWHISKSTRQQPKGAGDETIQGLRAFLGLEKPGAMEQAVVEWRKANPEPTEERVLVRDERFPNLARAMQFARDAGVEEAAIQIVLEDAHKLTQDLPMMQWLDLIRDTERSLLFARRNPALFKATDAATPPAPKETLKQRSERLKKKRET